MKTRRQTRKELSETRKPQAAEMRRLTDQAMSARKGQQLARKALDTKRAKLANNTASAQAHSQRACKALNAD
jgi:hypothetical protein